MFLTVHNRLFTHLFIALILITGTLCDPPNDTDYDATTEPLPEFTIQCYVCGWDECGGHAKLKEHIKNCTGFNPACEISTADGKLPERKCKKPFSSFRDKCNRKEFGSEISCSKYKSSVSDNFKVCNDWANNEENEEMFNWYEKPSAEIHCACRKDLCNAGHLHAAATRITSNTIFLTILVTLYLI